MTLKFLNKNKEVATLKAELDTLKTAYATLSAQVAELTKKPTEIAKVEVTSEVPKVETPAVAETKVTEPETAKADVATEQATFKAQTDTYNKDLAALSEERDALKASLEQANTKYAALEQQKVEVKAFEVNKAASQKLAAKAIPDGEIPSEPLQKTNKSKWIVPN